MGHSNAGGGGERVLWAAIKATQKRWPKAICVVYTGDHDATKDEMLESVQVSFTRAAIILVLSNADGLPRTASILNYIHQQSSSSTFLPAVTS